MHIRKVIQITITIFHCPFEFSLNESAIRAKVSMNILPLIEKLMFVCGYGMVVMFFCLIAHEFRINCFDDSMLSTNRLRCGTCVNSFL